MERLPRLIVSGVFTLFSLWAAGCSCPASFREVATPNVKRTADVDSLTHCQIEHYGTTLLGQADSADTARALLARGAKVRGKLILQGKECSGSPLNLTRNPEVVRVLGAAGANPDTQSGDDGSTPLCQAIRSGDSALAFALLAAGANPNLMDSKGEPPLCLAAARSDSRLCEMLLYLGSNVGAGRREDGLTPLLAALKAGGIDTAGEAKLATVQALVARGASLVQPDANGTMPLHVAPSKLIPNFLAAGVDVNCRDARGRTPLFYGGSTQRLDVLLQSGADMTARDWDGNTAFDVVPEANLKSYLLIRGCRAGNAL